MIGKLILVAYMAISFRTSKIETNPIDYEITGGFQGIYGMLDTKFERENGDYYKGLYIKTEEINIKNPKEEILKLFDGISAEININEATETNSQYLYKNLFSGLDIIKIRLSNQWEYWKGYTLLMGGEFDLSEQLSTYFDYDITFMLQYDSNFDGKDILRLNTSIKIDGLKGKLRPIYIEPKIKINNYSYRRNDWQFKTEVGFKL